MNLCAQVATSVSICLISEMGHRATQFTERTAYIRERSAQVGCVKENRVYTCANTRIPKRRKGETKCYMQALYLVIRIRKSSRLALYRGQLCFLKRFAVPLSSWSNIHVNTFNIQTSSCHIRPGSSKFPSTTDSNSLVAEPEGSSRQLASSTHAPIYLLSQNAFSWRPSTCYPPFLSLASDCFPK
jgi:hypothetical protein